MMEECLKFTKVTTVTDPTFWAKFAELKIDKLKLDEKTDIHLWGSYLTKPFNEGRANPLFLDCTSFNENIDTTSHNSSIACHGCMINMNTYEAFRHVQPQNLIDNMGKYIMDSIKNNDAIKEPWRLSYFIVASYADLKKYKFFYWVAHPTPYQLPELNCVQLSSLDVRLSVGAIESLLENFLQLDCRLKNYFAIFVTKENSKIIHLSEAIEYLINEDLDGVSFEIYFAFYDPCMSSAEPGWPLRNLLYLLFWHAPIFCFTRPINVISLRGEKLENSIIFELKVKDSSNWKTTHDALFRSEHFVGWETNSNGKMGPNIIDLSNTMDPAKLSERAINLNLKLMKWRLVPDLNLDKISSLKCLLLGAGTLGCSVARVLLGWAVNNIVLVDSSTVSHSNTVRQSLYVHQDAIERRFKADAAKDALLRINPNLNVEGVVLHIPMPGHVVGESMLESTRSAFTKLEELIARSDVVFLLLDSREARWLPTLLCAAMDKIVINAALGFDSYTVQRHGTRKSVPSSNPNLTSQNTAGPDLGCYFCNDVTQPGNSQTDRTLDQQCTVSRPGLSQIAAGLAVELLVALTQHNDGIDCKAMMSNIDETKVGEAELTGLLGGVPHTIRGSLWNHDMRLTVTHRFPSCTACSTPLIDEYKSRGFDFILDACNTPNYLEKLSGIEELLKRPDWDECGFDFETSDENED
ncbi:uncharacterized protein Atg7 [Prorops nasuta]|uniref:uncharacterized protein Atg7 n=1 Tax=Prorops nasuta TaxID=863751 RepID=UPI0034CECA43